MTSISGSPNLHFPVSLSDAKQHNLANLPKVHIAHTDEQTYNRFINSMERTLEAQYGHLQGKADNHPDNTYAEVVKNGKVIATLYNSGIIETSNAIGAKVSGHLSHEANGTNGPNLAQRRAEEIVRQFGGEIQIKETALNQEQFGQLERPHWEVDELAMASDALFASLMKVKMAREEYLQRQNTSA